MTVLSEAENGRRWCLADFDISLVFGLLVKIKENRVVAPLVFRYQALG